MRINAGVNPTQHRVIGYSGTLVNVCGETTVNVQYNNDTFSHTFLVVNDNRVNLLGRDLCRKLKIKFLFPSNNCTEEVQCPVLAEFKEYLSPEFKACVKETVSLKVRSDAKPVFSKARSVPIRMKEPVKKELQRLVDAGIITKVFSSDWSSPTVNVLKDNKSVRICGDFSATVNQFLEPVNSLLPSIDEVISSVGSASVFSKLDLANAFLQIPLDNESKKYTTISTSEGLFTYNYLPFGLCVSSGIFQAYMSKILNGIDNVIVYQDDVLIMASSVEDHNRILRQVLLALQNAGIKLNTSKCSFLTDTVHYLGHVFTKEGVKPNPSKVTAILEAPAPTNLKQLQAFIGLCNFYAKFIPKFSATLAPLYSLLKKSVKFHWGPIQQSCFQSIKELFAQNTLLTFYDPKLETLLESDSSGYGMAAVLMQRSGPESHWYPVQFISRTLNDAEKNYSNIEREALSVIFGTDKFRKFLLGTKFTIRNDQQPLRKLFAHNSSIPTSCSSRIVRWALKLTCFDYRFEYSKGRDNVNSDCFSRLPLPATSPEFEPYELVFTIKSLDNMPITCAEISEHTLKDSELMELIQYIKYGWPSKDFNKNLTHFKSMIDKLSILKGCILYCDRVFIPPSLRKLVLDQFHEGHPGICAMKSTARSLIWYPGIDNEIERLVKSCTSCQQNLSKPAQNQNIEWPVPPRVWARVHVDHFFYDDKICLIAVDALSRYIECEIVQSTSVEETIDALRVMFSHNGLCDVLVSDNASCFTAQQFKDFLNTNGIEHITPPPYSPSSNGRAERGVQTIKSLLKKSTFRGSFKSKLAKVLFYYRSIPHSITNTPPSIALNNRKFVTARDRVHPKFCYAPSKDKPRQIHQFAIGSNVLALNLREGPKWYRGTVMQKLGVNIYNVLIHDLGIVWKRHSNQLLATLPEVSNPNQATETFPTSVENPRVIIETPPLTIQEDSLNTGSTSTEPSVELRRSIRVKKPVLRYGFDD